MINDTHRRLRDATHADHQRLEDRMDILSRIAAPGGRRVLAQRFHGMHAEAEAALAPWLADLPDLDFEMRRRSRQLAQDLVALDVRALPAASDPIVVSSVGEALGRMYVLEGSTLGGRVIRRAVEAQGEGMVGLSFLDPYGDRVGERWRAFMAVVEAHARTPAEADAVVAGALAGFRHAELRLCEETADV